MRQIGTWCIIFSLFAHFAVAQAGLDVQVWFDSMTFDQKKVVRTWCQNNSAAPLHLNYQAKFVFGEKKEVRKGALLVSPSLSAVLTKSIFAYKENEFDTIEVAVFHKKKLLQTLTLLPGQPLPRRAKSPPATMPPGRTAKPAPVAPSSGDIEIDGLILDETRSKLAHDFYELFYNYWTSEGPAVNGHTITVREMPARIGIGSQVVVEIDDRQVTTLNLQPRGDLMEETAKQLVAALIDYFNNPNNFLQIDSDDLNGSGLY